MRNVSLGQGQRLGSEISLGSAMVGVRGDNGVVGLKATLVSISLGCHGGLQSEITRCGMK